MWLTWSVAQVAPLPAFLGATQVVLAGSHSGEEAVTALVRSGVDTFTYKKHWVGCLMKEAVMLIVYVDKL